MFGVDPQEACAIHMNGELGDGERMRGSCGAKGQMESTSQVCVSRQLAHQSVYNCTHCGGCHHLQDSNGTATKASHRQNLLYRTDFYCDVLIYPIFKCSFIEGGEQLEELCNQSQLDIFCFIACSDDINVPLWGCLICTVQSTIYMKILHRQHIH